MILKLQILKINVVFPSHIFSKAYLYILPFASEASLDISSKDFAKAHKEQQLSFDRVSCRELCIVPAFFLHLGTRIFYS
jgi:hypothetical protein